MPDEACKLWDPSNMPYTTLISKFSQKNISILFFKAKSTFLVLLKLILILIWKLSASSLHKRRCPQPGRYTVFDMLPFQGLSSIQNRNKRRVKLEKNAVNRLRRHDHEDEDCRNTDVHIGCSSMDQNEVILAKTCKHGDSSMSFIFIAHFFLNIHSHSNTFYWILNPGWFNTVKCRNLRNYSMCLFNFYRHPKLK